MPADDSAAAVRVRIRLVESVEGEWLVGAFGADCLPSSEGADAGRGIGTPRDVSYLPWNVRREGGQSLVIGGSSLVILEGKACNLL